MGGRSTSCGETRRETLTLQWESRQNPCALDERKAARTPRTPGELRVLILSPGVTGALAAHLLLDRAPLVGGAGAQPLARWEDSAMRWAMRKAISSDWR